MTDRRELDEAFIRLAALPDDEIPLGEGALRIAADADPELDIAAYLARLDDLAATARPYVVRGAPPREVLQALARFLRDVVGLRGNQGAYYDPRNSYLNEVLDRRLGIPITLSVIMIEVGWRLDLPLVGVGMPGHFVVRWRGEDLFADPFSGQILDTNGCYELVRSIYRDPMDGSPEWLEPVSTRQILTRMLYNLKSIWVRRDDTARAIQVVKRLLALNPGAYGEMRDLGALYARAGQRRQAIDWLQKYLAGRPRAPDEQQVRRLIENLASEVARWN